MVLGIRVPSVRTYTYTAVIDTAAKVVTFEVQAGTPGLAIAQAVAARLGYSYHDEDILVRAAHAAGVSTEIMADVERIPSLFIRMGEVLEAGRGHDFQLDMVPGRLASGGGWLLSRKNRSYLEAAMAEVAQEGHCVVARRGAGIVLKDCSPAPLRVFVHGSLDDRAARVATLRDIPFAEARALIRTSDREQAEYLKHVYHADIKDSSLFDLSICTDDMNDSVSAEVIVAAARRTSGAPHSQHHRDDKRRGVREPRRVS